MIRPRPLFITICLGIVVLRDVRADEVRAVAALIVNGTPHAETTIVWRDGVVWVPATALADAGVKANDSRAIEIDRVPHLAPANLGERVRVEWDEADVALKLTLPPELLPAQTIDIQSARPAGMIRPRPISADAANVDAVVQLQGSAGRVEVRHATVGRAEPATGVSVMGALVALDGRLHATRPVDDAFGVVKVADVPGVRAYVSHQYVGKTNARGEVVVPNLVSYYGNRLSIDPSDVPLDRAIGVDERIVAPAQRGGAIVRFEALRLRPVTGRVVVIARDQTIVPAFGDAEIVVAGHRLSSPIGVNGEFFVDDLGAGWQRMIVRYDGVRYACEFGVPDRLRVPGEAIDVGTVTCREEPLRAGAGGDELP